MPPLKISPRSTAAVAAAEIKVNDSRRERERSPGQEESKEHRTRMRDRTVKGEEGTGHAEAHSVSSNVHAEPMRRKKKRSRQHVETGADWGGVRRPARRRQ
jgi:hypothetical protein